MLLAWRSRFPQLPDWKASFFASLLSLSLWKQDEDAYHPAAVDAEKVEIEELLSRVNLETLASRASTLRSRILCTVPEAQYVRSKRSSVTGGMNYHLEIHFEDRSVWITRIRRFNATSLHLRWETIF